MRLALRSKRTSTIARANVEMSRAFNEGVIPAGPDA
jgi:hypothetical protein